MILQKPFMAQLRSANRGYITLISVLIALALGSAIAMSVVLLGLGSARDSLALDQSYKAKALADTCAEEALQQIRSATSFSGTGNLTLGQGTCTYTVTNTGSENRSITASGTIGTIVRKIQIGVTKITPKIIISSWQETAN